MSDQDPADLAGEEKRARSPKRIIVFADGTGNAFATQESSVWRLFKAVDQSQPDQIARYIRGVGTAGFRPFALLDGATGIGVPSNVRKLYRFICWNWTPDAEIWLFGFSRGAFTVRTLIGLIHHEGMVPADVSRAEMNRNAMSAWRAYRQKTAPSKGTWPTIWATRWLRDRVIGLYQRLRKQPPYEEIRRTVLRQWRADAPIRFLGVFDTVEAYGVPIEELRVAVDKAIWPISFRNTRLSEKVRDARHALSLDDERTSFHPIRFDPPTGQAQDIKEVWFAGVHSDVGGGYPDAALSYLPLVWMAEEAESSGLRFTPGALPAFQAVATPFGPLHDSRSGLGAAYRYDPRHIEPGSNLGTAPLVHHSVIEKMTLGSENYAPITLPITALVLMPHGAIASLGPPNPALHGPKVRQLTAEQAQAELPQFEALTPSLPVPNPEYIALTRDTVWWRRVAYFVLLVSVIATVALPWTASVLTRIAKWLIVGTASLVNEEAVGRSLWQWLTGTNSGIASSLATVSGTLGGVIPGYLRAWTSVLVEHFLGSLFVIAITYGLYRWNDRLRDLIADRASCSWKGTALRPPASSRWIEIARRARKSGAIRRVYRAVTHTAPYVALALLLLGILAVTSHAVMDYRSGKGGICAGSGTAKPVPDEGASAQTAFSASDLCWASGITLEKGRSYTLWIDSTEPFGDGNRTVGVAGFESSSPAFLFGVPLRRRWDSAWFQVLARVGSIGGVEWPLKAVDGTAPVDLDADYDTEVEALCRSQQGADRQPGLTAGNADVAQVDCGHLDGATRRRLREQVIQARLPHRLVSTFTAPESGEVFLYVNDAVYIAPLLPPLTTYGNNAGKARIFIRRVTAPAIP